MDDKRDNINTNNQNQGAPNVHSFGVQNQNSGAENIKSRIETSKKNTLNVNTKRTNRNSSISSKNGNNLETSNIKNTRDRKNTFNNLPKKLVGTGIETLGNKAKQSDSPVGDLAKVGQTAYNTGKKASAFIKLLKTPVIGKILIAILIGVIGIIGIIALGIIMDNQLQLIVSSIQMKFGLTSDDTYEVLTDVNEENKVINGDGSRVYDEGMTREEIENIIDGNSDGLDSNGCKETFIRKIAHLFGTYDMSNPCEFSQYLRKQIKKKEESTNINNIAPGYLINSLYYAFETQNYNEDGSPTITTVSDDLNENDEESRDIVSDLDAITLLFSKKKSDGKYIFNKNDIKTLLDEYILEYDYNYWKYEIVSKEGEPENWDCVSHPTIKHIIDTKKFELFLRYGEKVAVGDISYKSGNRGYEADKNITAAINATDFQCMEDVTNEYGTKPPSMEIYDTKAYPDVAGDDGAEITLADGNKYTYENGFIYTRYPRYIKEFTIDKKEPEFNFVIAKEIEKTIELAYDRQDYSNYLLGYDSDIEKYLDKNNSSSSATVICDYTDVDGSDESGTEENGSSTSTIDTSYKVQLMYPYKDSFSFDAFDFNSNTPMSNELVDIEKYVLGAVFAEAGDTPWQESKFITNSEATSKAFSIMTRSFLMANGTSTTNSGEKVIQIANSTTRQTYCDPDEGCYRCWSNTNNNNIILVPIDNEKAINNNQCTKVEPLPENSKLREYVEATVGQVMTTSSGTVASTQYDNTKLSKWLKEGTPDSSLANYDYTELLYLQYNDKGYSLKGVECRTVYSGGTNYIASGNWDSWKQGSASPWGNQTFGAGATMADAGCLITSFSKLIADANPSTLRIPNFNPGNFAQVLTANNCFEGNNLRNECALKVAVGEGNYTYSAANLSGTFEQKRKLITSFINSGYKVIISVNGDGHWVYVTGTTDTDILMSDPASSHGNSNSVLKTYGNTSAYYKIIKFT